jgi:hypothetical protein
MPTYEEIDVTPEMAARWMAECNIMNRNLRVNKVAEYAEAMKAGQWKLNGQGWSFDTDKVLVDGQHRCAAVERSGVTIRTLVVWDVAPGVRPTVDEGVKRNFADDLKMNGIRNSIAGAALLKRSLVWEANGGLARLAHSKVSRPTLAAAWPDHAYGIAQAVSETQRWKHRFPGTQGALDFTYWLLKYKKGFNPATVEKFFQVIAIGSQDEEDAALIKLVDQLSGRGAYQVERGQTGIAYQVYWMCKGWNMWLTGRQVANFALPRGSGGQLIDPYPALERALAV